MFDWLKLVKKEISLNGKCIRLDNSGEHNSFHHMILISSYILKFEFTAPDTPPENGKVERSKIRSMLNSARLTTTSDINFGQAVQV
jgi:hypothetical protein